MKNSFRVLKRDLLRLLKTPAALVVVIALVILPSLYTWFNVIGFWNPYDNTGNMRVCVVNEDAGAENDLLGKMNLGDQIVDQLHENSQLKWDFMSRDEAMEAVNSGQAYAAFVIPEDFTEDLFTILTADFKQPKLQYYVNEKMNPVSPKVTDAGSTTLDETINSQFVSTVSETIADSLNTVIADAQEKLGIAQTETGAQLDKALAGIQSTSETLSQLEAATGDAQGKSSSAKANLQGAYAEAEDLENKLQTIYDASTELQNELTNFIAVASPALTNANLALSSASTSAAASVTKISNAIESAQGSVDSAIQVGESTVQLNQQIIATLNETIGQLDDNTDYGGVSKADLQAICDSLEQQNIYLQRELTELGALSEDIGNTAESTNKAATDLNTSVQTSLTEASKLQQVLFGTALPEVNTAVGNVGSSALQLKAAVAKETVLIGQASNVLDELNSTLSVAGSALSQTNSLLNDLGNGIETAKIDVSILGGSTLVNELMSMGSVDPDKIADFMLSPTQVQTEKLYHLDAYGSAMAPLFISLSLWIGCIMLCVILKLEVDDEGVEGLTVAQGWFGRFMLFAILVAAQAAVCVAGCLYIGVQTANVAAFFGVAIFISLMYLCITYSLSSSFAHIGIGLCIIFVFVQIPGGTGLYPIEMTPEFFRSVYPFFPFTYGINALRETIAGFYGNQIWQYCGILLAIGMAFFLFARFFRPYLTNLNRLAAKEVAESDILNGEAALVPERRYRVHQMIAYITNHEDFRERADAGAARFMRYYPRLLRGALWVGIILPVVATLILHVNQADKVITLTLWLFWLFAVIIYLVIVEYIKNNLEHRADIATMSDVDIRGHLIRQGKKQMADELHIKGERPSKKWSPKQMFADSSAEVCSKREGREDVDSTVPELVEGPSSVKRFGSRHSERSEESNSKGQNNA